MNKRLVLVVLMPVVLLGGAGAASASPADAGSHQICIGVSSDPNSNGLDGICVRTGPL